MKLSKTERIVNNYQKGGSGLFARDQVATLQNMLRLSDYETASEIANYITHLIDCVEFYIDARNNVPRDSDEKEKLRDIAKLANQLHRLLASEPAIVSLLLRQKHSKGMTISEIAEIDRRPRELLLNLQVLTEQASYQARDDAEFASVRMLISGVNTKDPEIQIATRMLWPELFDIWTAIGKRKLAKTPNGPTHRFVALVHEAGDLPEPRASTLRDAINLWNGKTDLPKRGGSR